MGAEPTQQSINSPLSLRSAIVNTGGLVGSPFTGTANIAVLLFTAAGVVTGPAAFYNEVNDAAAGTSVTLTRAGVYSVTLHLEQAATQATTMGISQDVAAAGLNSRPAFTIAGFEDVWGSLSTAATNPSMTVTTPIYVDDALVGAGGSVIRFHATTSGGAAPAGDLNAAPAYYRIRLVNALHA